ncbi:hypothetical protein H6802_02550 [Candidatus Nomurabacteria bacterium]|uniref:Uncharacterized protein n=1 Tax=candidate division WWE3 bacterium TaxID=2053526 RepID=A0A955E1I8_UNCKA|nr:hypothetical protein [candidate division WWE3 bacterium]MCB9823814.1 hypothetical protein [Candidatus Nomurabacteria bacterium]MCB9826780.1 hypothetical protein [Candidatus Nomurabacteria bacterium]MCB9827609.1 hypothetical protein [Candidatus Nomurabacteria bacterium]HXK52603.1 hypothetical protein [bacterium]
MTARLIRNYLIKFFFTREYNLYILLRLICTLGPLLVTFLFSLGIYRIEQRMSLSEIVLPLALILVTEIIEHLVRVGSKSLISFTTEKKLVEVQTDFLITFSPKEKDRMEVVQAVRNLTHAIRRFVTHMIDDGFQGIVEFILIPFILLLIDVRVFYLEVSAISFYIISSYFLSRHYEVLYEKFDQVREKYYSRLLVNDRVKSYAEKVWGKYGDVQSFRFISWFSLQSLVSFFKLSILLLVVRDVFMGTKQISELVLIAGYVVSTKKFLNDVTNIFEYYMEIKAGTRRLEDVIKLKKLKSYISSIT